MDYRHIKDIDFNSHLKDRVYGLFMAQNVSVRKQKDGVTDFITLMMCDKDFKVEARRFGATPEEIEIMKNGGVYRAAINVEEYAKSPTGYSCIIYNFEPHEESPSNFIEWADGMQDAVDVINDALVTVGESIYQDLIRELLVPNWEKFAVWTAASSMHHDALGGLLVHTGEVISQSEVLADYWCERYGADFINKPLLISAALIHDLAKVKELSVDTLSGASEYSTQASLETHITMCVSMIDEAALKIGFGQKEKLYSASQFWEGVPPEVDQKDDETIEEEREALSLLKHCVLAHHGKQEYGSPITPHIPEAHILNIADNLSAEMYRYNKNFNTMDNKTSHTAWLAGGMVCTYKDSTK